MIVVISWLDHHARSEGLAKALDAEPLYMPWSRPGRRRTAPLRWTRSAVRTLGLVRAQPPGSTIITVAPPVFAPLVVLLADLRRRRRQVVDLHSGALNDPRWRWSFPLMRWLLRRQHLVVATNEQILAGSGVEPERVAIVHDLLELRPTTWDPDRDARHRVVFPASGALDEPLEVVRGAARELEGEVEIIVTGAVRDVSPAVRTGFLPVARYRALISGASAVLALTTREDTMQQAAYEALHLGVPVVSSNSRALREVLGSAAVFVDHSPEALVAGIREAIARTAELRTAATEADRRLREQSEAGLAKLRGLGGTLQGHP